MTTKKRLKRTVQCAKCPWKVSTNPHLIPDGYCPTKHENLSDTIAKPGEMDFSKPLKMMACHHSKDLEANAEVCIGWLSNQLNEGNNIPLRLAARNYENIGQIKTIGRQHKCFEDTLPKA